MTLTELSYYVRRALPFFILFALVFLIIFYSFKLYFVYLDANKTQVLYTNPVFGKIDKLNLKDSTTSAGFNFTLDTIEGTPVTATDTAAIYFLPDSPTRFGYREKILLMAKAFGFNTDLVQYKLEGKDATFDDGISKLTIDIGNFNFKYTVNIQTSSLISGSIAIPKTDIINKATDFLKSVGRYPDELAQGTNNVIYLKYDPASGGFVNVDRVGDASAVEVDFYRPNIGDISVVTPKFFNSQNYVVMNFQNSEPNVIKAQVHFFEKSDQQFGVYPLKSGDQAWADLKAGSGIIVAGRAGINNVTIKKMGLYYLDPDIYQTYFQPVYVFLGDNDFVAYVDAVKDEYVAN